MTHLKHDGQVLAHLHRVLAGGCGLAAGRLHLTREDTCSSTEL